MIERCSVIEMEREPECQLNQRRQKHSDTETSHFNALFGQTSYSKIEHGIRIGALYSVNDMLKGREESNTKTHQEGGKLRRQDSNLRNAIRTADSDGCEGNTNAVKTYTG